MTYRDTLSEIFNKTHDLSHFIHVEMEKLDTSGPEWAELYAMVRLISATGDMAYHIGALGGQSSARVRPVDNRPASLASCGHVANEDGECNCSYWPERAPLAV